MSHPITLSLILAPVLSTQLLGDIKPSIVKPPVQVTVHVSLKPKSNNLAEPIRLCISDSITDTNIPDGVRIYKITRKGVSPIAELGSTSIEVDCIKKAIHKWHEGVVSVTVEGPQSDSSVGFPGVIAGASGSSVERESQQDEPSDSGGNFTVDKDEYARLPTAPGTTQARVVPVFREGKIVGYQILKIRPGSIYERLGLEDGDILIEINGRKVDSPDKALQLFESLRSLRDFTIRLERDGEMTFNYQLR